MSKYISCLFQGFIDHVKNDHSMWAYILFFIHLNDTKKSDYTAVELYVFDMVSTLTKSMAKCFAVMLASKRSPYNHSYHYLI